jgi:integrase
MKTLYELWNLYQQEKTIALASGTVRHDYTQVAKWLENCPIQEPQRGREILVWILSQQPEKSSRKIAVYIKSLYKWASSEDVEYLEKNYVRSFKLPKTKQKNEDIVVIPTNEVNPFMSGLISPRVGKKWYLLSEFLLQTGMRPGEARALLWSDVKDKHISVSKTLDMCGELKLSTKTNRSRLVPINEKCKDILKECKIYGSDDYIFPINRRTYVDFFKVKATSMCNAGITTNVYRPYDLRHTAISAWIENNIPVNQCAKWAGNSPEVIWSHYCNVRTEFEIPEIN